jgi:hypothetical protein
MVRNNLFLKAIIFRLLVIFVTALFTGLKVSIILNIILFLLYYIYDIFWFKYIKK